MLSELIIPEAETAGAKAARVSEIVDLVLSEETSEVQQGSLRGLDWLDRKGPLLFGADLTCLNPKRRNLAYGIMILVLYGLLCGFAVASPLRAGLAVFEITPPLGETMAGYHQQRRAQSIHDPLFARVLLLRTTDSSLALITTDLHRLQSPALVARIRRELGIEHIILSSSHNHSAPVVGPDEHRSGWALEVEDKIFRAVRQANEKLFSAQISWGQGALLGAHNFRLLQDDGTVRERWTDPEEEVVAPIDPTVTVVRIDQEGAGLKAVWVHYACDPAILGPDIRDISAEFPGALARYVEKELGGNVVCLFAAGAAANIYPFRARLTGSEAYSEVERMGQRLGREVVRVASGLRPSGGNNELQVGETLLSYGNRWETGKRLGVGVSTVLINREVALLAVPAEMFLEFQLALRAKSPVRTALLLGSSYTLGDSWAGTVPTIAAAAEGGLGASYATDIEVGAGEAMVDHGVIQLYRFLGKLDDLPRGTLVYEMPDVPSP